MNEIQRRFDSGELQDNIMPLVLEQTKKSYTDERGGRTHTHTHRPTQRIRPGGRAWACVRNEPGLAENIRIFRLFSNFQTHL